MNAAVPTLLHDIQYPNIGISAEKSVAEQLNSTPMFPNDIFKFPFNVRKYLFIDYIILYVEKFVNSIFKIFLTMKSFFAIIKTTRSDIMTIQDRIKKIRKESGYNQADFGRKIGLSESAICNYESGRRSISEQTIKSICREFHINYDWLKYGEGKDKNDKEIDVVLKNLKETYNLDELDTKIIKSYLSLSDEEKEAFKTFIKKIKGAQ